MLIYIVIQFRTNLNERNVNSDAKFTKLGGKTYIKSIDQSYVIIYSYYIYNISSKTDSNCTFDPYHFTFE